MLTNPCPVIVHASDGDVVAVPTTMVHHRHFPEIRAEAASVVEGLAHLSELLARARDGVGSTYHRSLIDEAMTDVAEFLQTLDEARPVGETSRQSGAPDPDPLPGSCAKPNLSR